MADASLLQSSFLGGEVSKLAQGRYDRQDYRTLMNVCLNGLPLETGAWVRRPGSILKALSRGGAPARCISFDFQTARPYDVEFSDGFIRFFSGDQLVMTNDEQTVGSVSSANPASIATGADHDWSTGNTIYFNSLGATMPKLHNRPCKIAVTAPATFTIADAITGASIDGSTLGSFVSGNVSRVYEIASPYVGGSWASLRMVKADIPIQNGTTPGAVLLQGGVKPYLLQVETEPTDSAFATFSLDAIVFKDGPYFDPFKSGVLINPSATVGVINVTLSFGAYSASLAYSKGDYVTASSVNYKSLVDANQNHTPASSPTYWEAVQSADAIGPNGFTGADIGRHVRFFSEPAIWAAGTTYSAGDVVAYGGTGLSYNGATYWKALVGSNTNNVPGVDLTKWALFPAGAIWTWGRITALLNEINRATGANIGDLTSGGALAAAFDGITDQSASASAEKSAAASTGLTGYVGKNYTGSAKTIQWATIYPASDLGFISAVNGVNNPVGTTTVTINLRANTTAPASASDGTLLASSEIISNTTAPIVLLSTDQATSWNYVWFELVATNTVSSTITLSVAECKFFSTPNTGTSNGVSVQIAGDPLLYTTSVRTWRLGLYSDTTGWPTCGTWHEGRLWLSGVVANRLDASKSNDPFNFAPTGGSGAVAADNAISYTFDAPDVNPIMWMEPDQLGIVCGTKAGEWLVQATSINSPLTPTTIQAHRATTHKCANVEPRRTGLTLAVVPSFQRSLLEFFHDVYSGKFAADNLAEDAKHITKGNIAEIAFQHELTPIIWVRKADGTLAGVTYRRKTLVSSQRAEIRGWHRHELGSGRDVEFITVGASPGGSLDALTMVTSDESSGIRHVETLTDILDEDAELTEARYLDSALTPTAVSSSDVTPSPYGGLTLYGIWPHVGKTVTAWIGGLDCGDYTVTTDGQITVPYGDTVTGGTATGLFTADFASGLALTDMAVGFSFTSDAQIVRPNTPAESGARNGPAFGKLRRNNRYALQVEGAVAQTIHVGTRFTSLLPALFRGANGMGLKVNQQFSGIHRDAVQDLDSFDGMLCWRVTRPYPANIAAIGGFVETKDV